MKHYHPRHDGPLQPLLPHGLAGLSLSAVGLAILLLGICVLAPG